MYDSFSFARLVVVPVGVYIQDSTGAGLVARLAAARDMVGGRVTGLVRRYKAQSSGYIQKFDTGKNIELPLCRSGLVR